VEWLLNTYSPHGLGLSDDVFTINHAWLRAYAAEMRSRNLRIPFECISRADRLNPEMLDLLAELGLLSYLDWFRKADRSGFSTPGPWSQDRAGAAGSCHEPGARHSKRNVSDVGL